MKIRLFKKDDLNQISELENLVFEDETYPKFFFAQTENFAKDLFFVAEINNSVIGYCLGALSSQGSKAIILSLAIHPDFRKKGAGKKLTASVLNKLEELNISIVELTVVKSNEKAISLYEQFGFETISKGDLLQDGKERYLMQKQLSLIVEQNESNLLTEIDISISFVNLLFGIGIGLIALLVSQDNFENFIISTAYLILLVYSSLYSSLFYANATGELTRTKTNKVYNAIIFGNILSEFLGVFILVITIPLIIWNLTNNEIITYFVLIIDLIFYTFYHLSKYDLLERYFKVENTKYWITISAFAVLTITQTLSAIYNKTNLGYFTFCATLTFLLGLLLFAYKTKE